LERDAAARLLVGEFREDVGIEVEEDDDDIHGIESD
jgi:hypothetical protein